MRTLTTALMGRRLVAAALAIAATFTLSPAAAQTGATTTTAPPENQREPLSISPPTVELAAAPGQTLTQKFVITNGSTVERTIQTSVQNFTAADESGNARFSDEPTSYELASYSTVTPQSATIGPAQSQEFEVRIVVPADASPGGHYGAYFFEAVPPPTAGAVSTRAQVTGLILLRVAGDVREAARIESFTVHKPEDLKTQERAETSVFQEGPVDFSVRIRNEGNVQVRPEIEVVIKNTIGREVARLRPAATGNVLPNSVRDFRVNWDRQNLIGRYTADVTVSYGTNKQTLSSSTSFYGAPLLLIALLLGGLLFLYLFIWRPRKRLKKAFGVIFGKDEPAAATPTPAAAPAPPMSETMQTPLEQPPVVPPTTPPPGDTPDGDHFKQ